MSTILEHPDAQALLDQTDVSAGTVRACSRHLTAFVQRYLPFFYRGEQRQHAQTVLQGKLTGLQRKTTEPIANQALQKRRPLQHFVGAGKWDDDAVRAELRRDVAGELADPRAVLVVDNHGVPKKGDDSCGVGRQWCGHLGKVDNCQVGYVLAYAAPRGRALVDARLYLPADRAADQEHRDKTHVPKDVTFQEGWRIGLDLVRSSGRELPHGWVTGDDEFGRSSDCRAELRSDHERYVLSRAVQHGGAGPERAAAAGAGGRPGALGRVGGGGRLGGASAQGAVAAVGAAGGGEGAADGQGVAAARAGQG